MQQGVGHKNAAVGEGRCSRELAIVMPAVGGGRCGRELAVKVQQRVAGGAAGSGVYVTTASPARGERRVWCVICMAQGGCHLYRASAYAWFLRPGQALRRWEPSLLGPKRPSGVSIGTVVCGSQYL